MKPRTQFFFALGFLIVVFGIALFSFLLHHREPLPVFTVTINRDCAPWDGGAFTVSIPMDESVINISIYQSPAIRHPVTFSFPDESMQEGSAFLLLPTGLPQQLSGKVIFQSVEEGKPVEGEFSLTTESGEHFKGQFNAQWGNEIIYCG